MEADPRQAAMKSSLRTWRLTARAAILVGASLLAGAASRLEQPCPAHLAALSVMPEMTGRAPVRVESLASFLAADPAGLAEVLRAEEAWARANVPSYPPRPDSLAFRAGGEVAGRAGRALPGGGAGQPVVPARTLSAAAARAGGGRPANRWPSPTSR